MAGSPPYSSQVRKPSATGKHHIIMIGAGGVGKSALISRLLQGSFSSEYHPTRADSFSKALIIDGHACSVDILDTAGQETFTAMRDNYYRGGEGFLCVFSLADASSLEAAKGLREHVCRVLRREDVPFLLVGNKVDLKEERQVSGEEGRALVAGWGPSAVYMETSAKADNGGVSVQSVFEELTRRIIADKARLQASRPTVKSEKSCCLIQ